MNGLNIALHNENNNTNNNLIRLGFDGGKLTDIVNINNNSTTEYLPSPRTYGQANTDYPFTITRENGVITATINEWTATPSNQPSNLNYVGLESWNRTKTITLTDLVIKPL